MAFQEYLFSLKTEVEGRLSDLVRLPDRLLLGLEESMRYSLLGGGKRIRAVLVMATADCLTGRHSHVLDAACALEMVHAYSLIHDDLPCMDDDDYRRGRLTNHKVYGEANAVLAGDALLTMGLEVLSCCEPPVGVSGSAVASCVAELCRAAGPVGMVGGQFMDINSEGLALPLETLRLLHSRKTGALFRASVRIGAILSGASAEQLDLLTRFSEALGLAFQISDDLLDVLGDEEKLGKRVQKDADMGKATYPGVVGLDRSRQLLAEAGDTAKLWLCRAGFGQSPLSQIVDLVLTREN